MIRVKNRETSAESGERVMNVHLTEKLATGDIDYKDGGSPAMGVDPLRIESDP
jgi:hypothetical protein